MHASSAPYLVGTKNGLVVTWLTSTNLSFSVCPKIPPPPDCAAAVAVVVAFALLGLLLPPHAASIADAMPAAPPVSATRRVIARNAESGASSCLVSAHSKRSIAS